MLDTAAEVSVLSTEFVQRLFPGQDISMGKREVRALGGQMLPLKGPLKLKVEVCGAILEHPFFYYNKNPMFLMGFDLISAAALTTDSGMWSKITSSSPPIPHQPPELTTFSTSVRLFFHSHQPCPQQMTLTPMSPTANQVHHAHHRLHHLHQSAPLLTHRLSPACYDVASYPSHLLATVTVSGTFDCNSPFSDSVITHRHSCPQSSCTVNSLSHS